MKQLRKHAWRAELHDDGMSRVSRYFATVRRAIRCRARSTSKIVSSDKDGDGFRAISA